MAPLPSSVYAYAGNHRTLPQRDKEKGNSKKMTKARLGQMPSISDF